MEGGALYVFVAMAYGLLGAALSASYSLSPRLREAPAYHLVTVALILAASVIALVGAAVDFESLATFHLGARFFLFLGASLAYVPAVVYLCLHYADSMLEKILTPASRKEPPPLVPMDPEEAWRRVQTCLEGLGVEPSNVGLRERLAELYARMGFHDSAAYEYQKAAEWLERGYAHSLLLYKAASVLVDRKQSPESAVILLRRIVRLYPKSCFAAYARRVLSQYEAHLAARSERGAPPDGGSPEDRGARG